jgi:HSP20 family protein
MVAGVKPQDLDINITRDMVTIHGTREDSIEVTQENYFHKELYWGSFSRNIILPEEIDVEEADAKEKHGLLMITLPKLDKDRKTKLSVKSS